MNKVMLIGRVGADPAPTVTPSGAVVLVLSIATSYRYTDKSTKEKKEKTEWTRCVFWNRLAEIAGEYLKKGSQVYVDGRLETRKWQNSAGVDQYTTEVIVEHLELIGSGVGGSKSPVPVDPVGGFSNFDDDIPF